MNTRRPIGDLWFEPFINEDEIEHLVQAIANDIRGSYQSLPLFLPVLNGSYLFMADLTRALDASHRVEFIKYQSYVGTKSGGEVTAHIGLEVSMVKDQSVLIVEDIVDSGRTVEALRKLLAGMGAAEVRCATAFFKPDAHQFGSVPEFIGKEIPDDFVVGYGMDYKGWGRNWRGLYRRIAQQ